MPQMCLYVESNKVKFIKAENRMVTTRGMVGLMWRIGEVGWTYKGGINSGNLLYIMVTIANNIFILKIAKKVDVKCSHHRKKWCLWGTIYAN